MIEFLRDHPTVTVLVSAVALLLALALIGYAADAWGGVRLERAARRESQEADSPAASAAGGMAGRDARLVAARVARRRRATPRTPPSAPHCAATRPRPLPRPVDPWPNAPLVPPRTPESAAARALSDEFDAIVGRLRRGTDQLADDLTGDHLWLLDEREWCISALRWPTAVTAVAQ
jgi:hypothetical protein